METKTLKPYFVVIGLLLLASLALAFTVDVKSIDKAGIRLSLPDHVGGWVGQDMLFCQNPACIREYRVGEIDDRTTCPACGGELDTMSHAERTLLPPDTEIVKKDYRNAAGEALFVTIVLSGRERASIHRPQVCLVGQGYEILRSTVVPVPMGERDSLDVMSLETQRRMRTGDGRVVEVPSYFAYWFVGKDRETPYHIQRMVWMATDRIFHNISHRWAYIAVSGMRQPESDDYQQQLQAFVSDFYPHIVVQ